MEKPIWGFVFHPLGMVWRTFRGHFLQILQAKGFSEAYSRVPIRRGVRNKRSGTQDEKCIGRNISHMCLGLYSRCRFILTNLYLKVLHFDILIQLKGTAHFLENVLGLIKGVCRINVPCLLIGTREYTHTKKFWLRLHFTFLL